ncbi:MAG: hypothetical protein ACYS8X_12105 [Planctomycetota bacterium]|jgi:hypothetical protein
MQSEHRQIISVIAFLTFGLLAFRTAFGGLPSLPLRADVDLAEFVVVGKILEIEKAKEDHNGDLIWGRATLQVREVLKGEAAERLQITVVMHLAKGLSMDMASPPHVYHNGDEGIWVIRPDGRPSHAYGLLRLERLDEVKRILRELDNRIWSQEVGGLQVCAEVVTDAYGHGPSSRPIVIFAVKNVSDDAIWVPDAAYANVVKAVARHADGREFILSSLGERLPVDENGSLRCERLQPGEIRYMHPNGENYGSLRTPKKLPAGEYRISVTLSNIAKGVVRRGPTAGEPIDAWQGSVTAPPVTMTISKGPDGDS